MKGTSRIAPVIAAIALLASGSSVHAFARTGKPAPPYSIETFAEDKIASDQLRGQVVILNFWATWCGPCRKELPELDRYFRAHRQEGLRIFAVTEEDMLPDSYLKPLSDKLSFPLAHHIKGSAFGAMEGLPTSYVIDRKGVLRYARAAAFTPETLDAVVGPLLAEPLPPTATATAAP